MIHLDRIAWRLVDALQRHGKQSAQQLADAVGMSVTPVWRRLKELEQSGVVRGDVVLMDREKLGLAVCVWAYVTLVRHEEQATEDFERLAAGCPEIMECASITGEADYVIKVVVSDMKAYDRFLQDKLFRLKSISGVRSNVVLKEVKYETALPLPPAAAA
jgi:Lrp/AsnC family transcriptional regulator, leucine-responsive regulatory protein